MIGDPIPDNIETIWVGSNLEPEDVTLSRVGYNLLLSIDGTDDSITAEDAFRTYSTFRI